MKKDKQLCRLADLFKIYLNLNKFFIEMLLIKFFFLKTGLVRLERTACRLGGDRSIQLSYSPNNKAHSIIATVLTMVPRIIPRTTAYF